MRTCWSPLLLAALAAPELPACSLPHEPLAQRIDKSVLVDPAWWVSPAVSGAWFNPDRSGEGIILQMLPNGRVLAIWFTFPAAGEAGEQAWLIAQDGTIDGDRIQFDSVVRPQGGRFGAAFDPSQVQLSPWGTLSMQFSSCSQASVTWSGPAAWGSGTRSMSRLTSIDQVGCNPGSKALTPSGARAMAGLRSRSGAWFVPSRSGEGWIVEELPDGRDIVYWFTFTPDGQQAWTVGSGAREGTRLRIDDNRIARGTRFGSAFNAADVQLQPWGTLEFDFASCGAATLSYNSTLAGWGSASRAPQRLTTLAGGTCLDSMPAVPSGLQWAEKRATPEPFQSEHAVAVYEGSLYVMGGFRAPQSLRRYDPASNSWTVLPDMPGGRDHLAAYAVDGGVYYVGGSPNGGGDQNTGGFRYDVAAQRWEQRPEMISTYGSQGATLIGRGHVSDTEGKLYQYDPHTRRARIIPAIGQIPRDHGQVIAYLDEIWLIGGRSPETSSVSIWDPASASWRAGPFIRNARGGFAASVVGPYLVIAGGELISSLPLAVEPTSEIYGAGWNLWQEGPDLPLPVHGVAGGAVGNRFYIVSGSTVAGTTFGAVGRVFELTLPQ